MSSGRDIIKFVIANTFNGNHVIVDAPKDFTEYDILDGCFCSDNPFTNEELLPKEKGLYEIECEYIWDDGRNAFFESSDPDWSFEILKVTSLYQI